MILNLSIIVFGITGTNGKTTTSYMLRNILEQGGKSCSLVGTIGHHIGDKDYEAINTTPGAELLSDYFKQMEAAQTECCVMEVSSHALAQGRVDNIPIAHAAFMNLTQDHLDYHKSMEEYYQTKKKLFQLNQGASLINIDDAYGRRLYKELLEEKAGSKVRSYSLQEIDADYRGEIVRESLSGFWFRLWELGRKQGIIRINLSGKHSVYDALAAIGLAKEAGIQVEDIEAGLKNLVGIPGRFEIIKGLEGSSKEGFAAIIDYAHTPDALENLLRTVKELKQGRLICVFGCGGERDKEKRAVMGKVAGTYSDYCIITNDNPRSENPEDIVADIEEGLYNTGGEYHIITNRRLAIRWAVSIWQKGDIIVVAGKGHEKYQVIGKEKRNFDDRAIIREFIGQE